MKKAVVFLAAALLVLGSALPLAGYWLTLTLLRQTPAAASSDPGGSGVSSVPPAEPGALPAASAPPAGSAGEVLLQDSESGQTFTLSMRDYLIGAVASEMPVSWPDEALKAQAVACHSYILYCREANYARLSALVDQVAGAVLYYDGAPAGASYFAISNGQTEASENVWGSPLPYLRAVDSSTDLTAQDYEVTVTLSAEQVSAALADALGISTAGIDPSAWFGTPSYTPYPFGLCRLPAGLRPDGVGHRPAVGSGAAQRLLCHPAGGRRLCHHHPGLRPRRRPEPVGSQGPGRAGPELDRDPGPLLPRHHPGRIKQPRRSQAGAGAVSYAFETQNSLSRKARSWLPRLSDGAGCAAGAGSSCSMAPSGSCTDQ